MTTTRRAALVILTVGLGFSVLSAQAPQSLTPEQIATICKDVNLISTGSLSTRARNARNEIKTISCGTPIPSPTSTLSASPTSITAGQSSILNYTTTNATSVTLNGDMLPTLSGSITKSPTTTTVYTLVATGAGGSVGRSVTVTVTSPTIPAPTASLSAAPSSIMAGQSSVLTYSTTNATTATLNGSPLSALAGTTTVTPTQTTTYTLVATGAGGSATQSATVTVNAVTPSGVALLDDFSDLRSSLGSTRKLWEAYTSEGNNSSVSVANGELVIRAGSGGSGSYWSFNPNGDNNPNNASYPTNAMQSFIEQGARDPLANRFSFWLRSTKGSNPCNAGHWELGTYIIVGGPYLRHFYHTGCPKMVPNEWTYVEVNRVPQHEVGVNKTGYPDDLTFTEDGRHYLDGMNRFYFNNIGHELDGSTIELAEPRIWREDGMATVDAQVSTIFATYDPASSKYWVTWAAPNPSARYTVKFSNVANAGSSATDGGSVGADGTGYNGVSWSSPAMARVPVLYVDIYPSAVSGYKTVQVKQR